MDKNLFPDIYVDSILDIDIEGLKNKGIKGFLIDIDNTIIGMFSYEPPENILTWLKKAKAAGISICIVSNTHKIRAQKVSKIFGIHAIYMSRKPQTIGILKALKYLKLEPHEAAMIGDQIFSDIKGGNRAGLITILTKVLTVKEAWYVRIKRPFEKRVLDYYFNEYKKEDIK